MDGLTFCSVKDYYPWPFARPFDDDSENNCGTLRLTEVFLDMSIPALSWV